MKKDDSDHVLASDGERDLVVNLLSDAYASGRLTDAEFEQRSGQALSGRTHGELNDVLRGLGELERPKPRSKRQIAFWVASVPLTAAILFGVVVVAFGAHLDDKFGGLVLLLVFVPVLLKLHRWAWPRSSEPG